MATAWCWVNVSLRSPSDLRFTDEPARSRSASPICRASHSSVSPEAALSPAFCGGVLFAVARRCRKGAVNGVAAAMQPNSYAACPSAQLRFVSLHRRGLLEASDYRTCCRISDAETATEVFERIAKRIERGDHVGPRFDARVHVLPLSDKAAQHARHFVCASTVCIRSGTRPRNGIDSLPRSCGVSPADAPRRNRHAFNCSIVLLGI